MRFLYSPSKREINAPYAGKFRLRWGHGTNAIGIADWLVGEELLVPLGSTLQLQLLYPVYVLEIIPLLARMQMVVLLVRL